MIHPSLADELEEIRNYYNSRSEGLGVDFVNEFERQVLQIAAMPERWMSVRGNIRRSLMKRFPYVILFRIISGLISATIGCATYRRRWKQRIPSSPTRQTLPLRTDK